MSYSRFMFRRFLQAAAFMMMAAIAGSTPAVSNNPLFLQSFFGKGSPADKILSDEEIVAHAQLVATGENIELYKHETEVSPEFAEKLDHAFKSVHAITSIPYDNKTLGPKLRVYVSSAVYITHVWHGYEHSKDPRGIIFLDEHAYRGAIEDRDITYVHEITHLFTWRYVSHSLREGFADYVALKIREDTSLGPIPNRVGDPAIPSTIQECLGTTKPPQREILTNFESRRTYYLACRRFVRFLVDLKGIETFLELYASPQPEKDIERLYGINGEEAIRRALRTSL